jgi:hypothetical protein
MRRWIGMLVGGGVLGGGFYLLLIDTTSLPELYVLAGVAVACGLAFAVGHESEFVEARIRLSWLLRIGRLAKRIPLDIGLVCWEALVQLVAPRRTRGTFRAAAFGAVNPDPADAGRRALVEALGSVAPNTIIVGVDSERGLLLVHQLRRQGDPDQLDVLGLG